MTSFLHVRKPQLLWEMAYGPNAVWAVAARVLGLNVLCLHVLLLKAPLPFSRLDFL